MNDKKHSVRFYFCARIFAVLFAGIFLVPASRAQTNGQQVVENRLLLVFDTSADMKKRVPMVRKALENIFVTGLGGQLQAGDSIGVWTFDRDLRTGQLPLKYWVPEEAVTIVSNFNAFAGKQHYSKTTSFGVLQPLLNQLARDSERLTVLIFCDGETPMSGTPYDAGINQIFRQQQDAQKAARQPFIVVLRAQLGQYVGCTVDFPPAPVNFPSFPPLPQPAAPKLQATNSPSPAAPTNQPPSPTPRVVLPPMVMIGTKPSPAPTNQPPPQPVVVPPPIVILINTNVTTNPPTAPKLEVTNLPAPAAPAIPVAETNAATAPAKISTVQTNVTAALPVENSRLGSGGALAVGVAFLLAAGGLAVFTLCRPRKTGSASLITHSMKKK